MSSRKKLNLNTVAVDLGCSCSRPKLSFLFHTKPNLKTTPKPPKRHHHNSSSSASSWTATTNDDDMETSTTTTTTTTSSTATPLSPNADVSKTKKKQNNKKKKKEAKRGFGRVGGEGVAVEKESDDPYLDFRQSMLQMILENEIYSKDDLRELLNCFLQLNSPAHHAIIVRAFTEIWDGVFSAASGQPKPHYYSYNKNDNADEQNDTVRNYYAYNDGSRDCYYNYPNYY